jgi:hypothetical protein
MSPETVALVRYHWATTRSAVPVATCNACAAERVLSPQVVVENGLPRRCAECGHREISITSYRVGDGGALEPTAD